MHFQWAILTTVLASGVAAAAEPPLDYNRDIRPILAENCFHCHGADAAKREAELRLDVRESAVELGAIVPGDVGKSSLVERINSSDPDVKMPPPDSKRQLTADQIARLTQWVAEGAEYKPHWAFQPIQRPAPPEVVRRDWPRNAIDRFVLAKLEGKKLTPSPRAAMPVLLRRISFDVTGLPPTPQQLAAWQATADPIAAAVDELLASPHYGERMAVDWLDVARYADTHGFNNDSMRIMWRWRDWAVDAFNSNMPYSRFITAQLAGDLLPDATLEDKIATGFNRNHVINSEGGIIDEEYRVEYVADRVRTTSLAWLGLTLECARCHDHKFDPLSQRDYFQMFAFFNSVDETGEDGRVGNAAPLMRAPTKEQQKQYAEMSDRDAALESELKRLVEERAAQGRDKAIPKASNPAAWDAIEKQIAMNVAAAEPLHLPAAKPEQAKAAPFDLAGGWTWLAWVKRDAEGAAPLISTMNFSVPASSGGYGAGMQIGLTSRGAVDVRLAVRWPAYSLEVTSNELLPVGEWRHIAVSGLGNKAEGVRIFVDGVEAETDVRHDDLTGNISIGGDVQIGHSGAPADNRFQGSLHRARLVSGKLDDSQLDALLTEEMSQSRGAADSEPTWEQKLAHVVAAGATADQPFASQLAQWKAAHQSRLAFLRTFPTTMIVRDVPQPRETFILERGQYDKHGATVQPGVPQALGLPLPDGVPRTRLALAKWLTDPRQPLTARVVANRFWHSFFGVGLVKTVEDLGTRSEWPSHPELLDWLASEFIDSGWDVKHLVRLIVESAAYQQDSAAPAAAWAQDPENRLLARGPRQRLTAEMIRDQALAASGLLAPRLGGPAVYPFQPADLYKGIVVNAPYPGTTYTESTGEDLHRRSLYTFWKRTVPHPTMSTFDAPDREFCTARRSVTNTPLQALVLMNDPIFLEASRELGRRMLAEGGATDDARLAWAFELMTARKPDGQELARLVSLLDDQRAEFRLRPEPPKGLLQIGPPKPAGDQSEQELAAYANVASLLLNLDESVARN